MKFLCQVKTRTDRHTNRRNENITSTVYVGGNNSKMWNRTIFAMFSLTSVFEFTCEWCLIWEFQIMICLYSVTRIKWKNFCYEFRIEQRLERNYWLSCELERPSAQCINMIYIEWEKNKKKPCYLFLSASTLPVTDVHRDWRRYTVSIISYLYPNSYLTHS